MSHVLRFLTLGTFLLLGSALASDGTDMPGSDYDQFEAPTPQSCRASCGADARCQAYTWVRPGVQGPAARCWLKNAVPAARRNPCCASETRQSFTARGGPQPEQSVDRPGSDFKHFPAKTWQQCLSSCQELNHQCKAWSWVRPGVQGPAAQCWLKNAAPHPVASNNTVSGVMYAPASRGTYTF